MQHLFTSTAIRFSSYARRGALLLALGAMGPAAWGQSFGPARAYSVGSNNLPAAVAMGDVNNDGRLDVVAANYNTGTVAVLLGQNSGGFSPVSTYSAGTFGGSNDVALGDVNGDGRLDIVTANGVIGRVGVLLGQPSGFGAPALYPTNGIALGVRLGDVNGDGRLDIVVANDIPGGGPVSGNIVVLLGQTGGFAPATAYSVGTNSGPVRLVVGDVNADGRADIVAADYTDATVDVLLGQASGFAAFFKYPAGNPNAGPVGVALGDVNGDSRQDIVSANQTTSDIGVITGQTFGLALSRMYATTPLAGPRAIALEDVTGDGRPDVVVASSANSVGVLVNQNGTFPIVSAYSAGLSSSRFNDLALGDVNGDGRLDIVVADEGTNSIGVLLNTGTYTPLAARPATAAPNIALAPNPAHEAFTVTLPTGTTATGAELRNALGQVVRRPAAAGPRFAVETAGLAPGVYTLRLTTDAGTVTKRVVVE
jgi:predicted nucleotidyltransferase